MDLPSLELIHDCYLYTSGEVVVHPSAAIAPGVLLQADPGCRLIIAEGVCVGRGSILHASGGTMELQAGATLGTGVLIVGSSTIGIGACIGSMTTILHSSVLPQQSIPPGSLIGDFSRTISAATPKPPGSNAPSAPPAANLPIADPWATPPSSPSEASNTQTAAETNGRVAPEAMPQPTAIKKTMTQVYGQAYVERIMITMFPHRQALELTETNSANPPDPPS
jgi:carbon dioxide concentrating mechanism protein CcmN